MTNNTANTTTNHKETFGCNQPDKTLCECDCIDCSRVFTDDSFLHLCTLYLAPDLLRVCQDTR